MHDGVDIAAPEGTWVKAARSGHVIYASDRIGGYGRMIILRHPDSFATVYAHLSAIHARKGQFIAKGQYLGKVGQTGHAEGPHLHFEVRNNRVPVNPLLYLHVNVAANILRR
jgi:murein DD-endopeptidase MepM/ murein hydrolase activator NlpD